MKYLVICTDSQTGVSSVDSFDTELDADEHLKDAVVATWEEMVANNQVHEEDDWHLEISDGFGRIDTDEISYQWSIWPLDI